MIIWITGQPASGKTTIARALYDEFCKNKVNVVHIDGDELRNILKNHDYSEQGRKFNVEVAQSIAKAAVDQSHISHVIVSMVSPYRNQRERFKKVENVKEIYLTSDRIRDGKMVECYEPPLMCYREINTNVNSVDKCVNEVLEYMDEKDNL